MADDLMIFSSSQGSQYEQHQIRLPGQENVLPSSSPIKSLSDASEIRSTTKKLRKPPTVTPKRFTRFFTPRDTSSSRGGNQSKSGRQLRDITQSAINRRKKAPVETDACQNNDDDLFIRPNKRRRQSFDNIASSPPPSSPLKYVQSTRNVQIFEDDILSSPMLDTEEELPDLFESFQPFPKPIRRLQQARPAQRILQRSFGGYDTLSRGWRGPKHCADWQSTTANFVTLPSDSHAFRGTALPFCTASCHTNSLIAIGDEEGSLRLIDTNASYDFSAPHLSFRIHHNAIMDVAFSSDDYLLATASGDQTSRIVDMQTQKTMCILSGHGGSLKQVRFHPDDNKMLTTSGRDGSVQIWDLRCSGARAIQTLDVDSNGEREPSHIFAKHALSVSAAHRTTYRNGKEVVRREKDGQLASSFPPASITALAHLPHGRSHLLLTASEANASLKLWDLRQAGRRSRTNAAMPVTSTPLPETQNRSFGVSALALSGDGARTYSVCRDSTVYAYSTNHLVLGSAPEMVPGTTTARRVPKEGRMGMGPLYAFKHPSLRVGSFYIKAAIRPARGVQDELLAVGSTDGCAVLFPTDERHLPLYNNRARAREDTFEDEDEDEEADLPTLPSVAPVPAPPASRAPSALNSPFPIMTEHGTALVRGHTKEVTSLTFTPNGELVTLSDDFRARCWREDANKARDVRMGGESGGNRWGMGWAEVEDAWDEEE